MLPFWSLHVELPLKKTLDTNWSEKLIFSLPQAAWKTWHRLWFINPPTHTIWTLYKKIYKNGTQLMRLVQSLQFSGIDKLIMLTMFFYWLQPLILRMCFGWSRPHFGILSIYASASKNLKKMNRSVSISAPIGEQHFCNCISFTASLQYFYQHQHQHQYNFTFLCHIFIEIKFLVPYFIPNFIQNH